MDWTTMHDNWAALVPALMQRWPEASEADPLATEGDREAVTALLARKTGQDRREIAADLSEWQMGEMPADLVMDPTRDNANIARSGAHLPPGEDALDDDATFGDDGAEDPPLGRNG